MSLVKLGGNDGSEVYEFRSRQDQELRGTLEALKESKRDFESMNDVLRDALDVHPEKGRSLIARFLALILPRSSYGLMPARMLKLMAEEADVLELIERLMRTNITNLQDAVRSTAQIGIEKHRRLEELKADIKKARAEKWSAQKLQQYMAERAGIQIYSEVSKLLDEEFGLLPDEDKEARKESLLQELDANVDVGQDLIKLVAKVGSSGLQIFHRAVSQYYAYYEAYVPIKVIRDSAEVMTDMNESMYASKEALIATMQKSIEAIGMAIDASGHIVNYAIASPDTRKMLEDGRQTLEAHLEAIRENEKKILLESAHDSDERQITDGQIVDAEAEVLDAPHVLVMRRGGITAVK